MSRTLTVGETSLAYDLLPAAAGTRSGTAATFVFQHGMGGNTAQPLGYVGDEPPVPVACLSARGHAPSDDLTAEAATFDVFADDVIAMADRLGLDRFVAGGISLGAGTAVNLAIRYPGRVSALVLCRPAWLDRPQAELNQAAYRELADVLDELLADGAADDPATVAQAADRYRRESTIYREVEAAAPAAASSLTGQLTRPRAAENSVLLRRLPAASPTTSTQAWARIDVPTLVVGHRDDPFHPYPVAEAYAGTIPGAELCTVPSKDADAAGFAAQIRAALHTFLRGTLTRTDTL